MRTLMRRLVLLRAAWWRVMGNPERMKRALDVAKRYRP